MLRKISRTIQACSTAIATTLLLAGVLLSGCSQFRGMPSHGGGKRFDEEQRALAGAIRRAVACMDLCELQGKKVLVVVTSLATSGSGTTDFPGPQFLTLRADTNRAQEYDTFRRTANGVTVESRDSNPDVGAIATYRLSGAYRAANTPTEMDLNYFRSALDMKVRHCGINVIGQAQPPDVVLYVLVDVLGTNQSRTDYFAVMEDELLASCEVTYYAQEVRTGKLLFKARQTGAQAAYREQRLFLLPVNKISRNIVHAKPEFFDVDGRGSATQPEAVDVTAQPQRIVDLAALDTEIRNEVLESLYDRARYHLESGNAEAAEDVIQRMREIDPGYRGLGDLSGELQRMTPPR